MLSYIALFLITAVLALPERCHALNPGIYARNSVLASGRWIRIKSSGEGLNIVSLSDLRSMGFSDPSKVRVYGTGGAMLPEELTEGMTDDLPLQPSILTDRGLLFFARDTHRWRQSGDLYSHVSNPYNEDSYYFLSDIEPPKTIELSEATAETAAGEVPTFSGFMARLVHERDMAAPDETGRLLLGEDFRTERNRSFGFSMSGKTQGAVAVRIAFGAKVTNGQSTLMVTANGETLQSTTADVIGPCSADMFIRTTLSEKEFETDGNKLNLGINYSNSGALFTARLDYIEVFYPRRLSLEEGQLHFYRRFEADDVVEINGCNEKTVIWDVTDAMHPAVVASTYSTGKRSFRILKGGYREFVAFNPEIKAPNALMSAKVENQDIHGAEIPELLIISPSEYMEGARMIARLHEQTDGMKVSVLTPEEIYNEFSGGHPDVMAFRKLLKMWHDRSAGESGTGIRYCLIMGRGSYDSKMATADMRAAGYRPVPMWQSVTGQSEVTSFSNDDIIGMLDDVTEEAFDMESAHIHVAVGRLPVKSGREATDIAKKIRDYATSVNYGSWRNRVMLIADDSDNGIHLNQSEEVYEILKRKAPDFRYERVYLDSYPLEYTATGQSYPKAKERILRLWNEGVVFTNYIGHGSPTGWTHEKLLEWKDFLSLSNRNLSILYASTCGFGKWDGREVSGAETILLSPKAGMIAIIAASRTVYMQPNGQLNIAMAEQFPDGGSDSPVRLGDFYMRGKNGLRDDNKLRYCLMGDPALRFPVPRQTVGIRSINGIDLDSDSIPELKALDTLRLEGDIKSKSGETDESFNGTISVELYDAESPVVTNGNGETGVVSVYNDRKVRLASVSSKVTDGKWSLRMTVPSEISNNYSPARIIAYACDGKGAEAHGSTERLYVYGLPETESVDTVGPEISAFYMNHEGFRSGDFVNTNPVAFARFSDPSGINVSEAGIGRRMLLVLDGNRYFEDVASYYTSDPDNEGAGAIAYPLQDLTPGRHRLELTVYDNVGNASQDVIEFIVAPSRDPVIIQLEPDRNPASTAVVFEVRIDRPNTNMSCLFDIYDLNGRKVWHTSGRISSDINGSIQFDWNLCDASGTRVPRGIYLCRVTVETPEGMYSSKTQKLAVTSR